MPVKRKGGSGGFREWGKRKRRRMKKMDEEEWKDGGTEPHGMEKLQVARELIAGNRAV